MLKKLLTLPLYLLLSAPCLAQYVDIDQILKTGQDNAEIYFDHYMSPAAKSFGFATENAWVSTAKAKELLEWKVKLITSLQVIPSRLDRFGFNPDEYQNLTANNLPGNQAPTIFGQSRWNTPTIPTYSYEETYPNAGNPIVDDGEINVPTGFGIKRAFNGRIIPLSYIQAEMGLSNGMEVKLRFSPWIGKKEWRTYTVGLGFMHNFSELESFKENFPIDLAAFLGLTYTANEWALKDGDLNSSGPEHYAGLKSSNVTIKVVGSKTWGIFSVYTHADFAYYFADAKLHGIYKHEVGPSFTLEYVNPIKSQYRSGIFGWGAGAMLDLGYFSLEAGYAINRYSNIHFGIGAGMPGQNRN